MRIADFFPHSSFRIPHSEFRISPGGGSLSPTVFCIAECRSRIADWNAGVPPARFALRIRLSQNRLRQRAVSRLGSRACRPPARIRSPNVSKGSTQNRDVRIFANPCCIVTNMNLPVTRKFYLVLLTIILLFPIFSTTYAFGQEIDTAKLDIAVSRSKKAAEIIKAVMTLPDGKGIPKDVIEKANVIGVVPDAFQLSLLIRRAVRGHGVLSVRRETGWTLPIYYFYGGSGGPSKAGAKNFDIVLVVVDADLNGDQSDKPKSDKKKGKAGNAKLFLYSFSDGVLAPMKGVKNHVVFINSPSAVYDESLNKLVYGVKGDDIVSGKTADPKLASPDVAAFRDALTELYQVK